jgi:hypothetical protein
VTDSPLPAVSEAPGAVPDPSDKKTKKKTDKVRSAWIAFIGRIVAQIIGAIATIVLGLYAVGKYHAPQKVEADKPLAASVVENLARSRSLGRRLGPRRTSTAELFR